jgi:serine/threonine protein kinase
MAWNQPNFISTRLNSKNGQILVETPENYQAIRVINEGAHGVVFEAWDQTRARRLAIKKLRDVFAAPGGVRNYYREFVLGVTVFHNNIIRVKDAYSPQQTWYDFRELYLVFDYMDFDLHELNARHRDLFDDPRGGDFLGILMRQLLCAVKHLHQDRLRLIHRDIKPANILVRLQNGSRFNYLLKLADLGSSRQLPAGDEENISRYVVTRPYRAPEITLTDNYGIPVDLWSVGCVLVELIINRVLFDEKDALKLVYCIMGIIGINDEELDRLPPYVRDNVLQNRGAFENNILEPFLLKAAPNWSASLIGIKEHTNLAIRLLTFNPIYRITAEDALNLSMWAPMGDRYLSEGEPDAYVYVEDTKHRNFEQWKQVLFNQLQEYRMLMQHQQ